MYTLKFIAYYEDGSNTTDVVSCVHYSVYERKNGVTSVTTYPTMLDEDGVDRHILHDENVDPNPNQPHFRCCYVENHLGKTIFVIRPLKPSQEPSS